MEQNLLELLQAYISDTVAYNCAQAKDDAPRHAQAASYWTREEDYLLEQIMLNGGGHWAQVSDQLAQRFPRKSTAQISQHWRRVLLPKLTKNANVDKEKIMTLYKIYGNQWAFIAKQIGGVSDLFVKHLVAKMEPVQHQ